jgi:hypothetical protein
MAYIEIESEITLKFKRPCSFKVLPALLAAVEPLQDMVAGFSTDCKDGTALRICVPKGRRAEFEAINATIADLLA